MISPTKIKRDDEDCGGGDGQHDCDKEEGNPAGHSPLSPTVGSHDAVRYSYNGSDYGNDYHYRDAQGEYRESNDRNKNVNGVATTSTSTSTGTSTRNDLNQGGLHYRMTNRSNTSTRRRQPPPRQMFNRFQNESLYKKNDSNHQRHSTTTTTTTNGKTTLTKSPTKRLQQKQSFIFQIFKFGAIIISIVFLFMIWKTSNFIQLQQQLQRQQQHFNWFHHEEQPHESNKKNHNYYDYLSSSSSFDFKGGDDIVYNFSPLSSSPTIEGQQPLPSSHAMARYIEWTKKEEESLSSQQMMRQMKRRERTSFSLLSSTTSMSSFDHIHYFQSAHFDFRKKKNSHQKKDKPLTSSSSSLSSSLSQQYITTTPNDQTTRATKRDTTTKISSNLCGISAQSASQSYPAMYPSHYTVDSDSIIIISGIVSSTIGYHLAMKLYTECHVQMIYGIDAVLPNTKQHSIYTLDQLHILHQQHHHQQHQQGYTSSSTTTATSILQPSLIIPYTGFNPKNGLHHHLYQKLNQENDDNNEIDFSLLQPTHVVHIMSNEVYKMSSLDGSDSIYMQQLYDKMVHQKGATTTSTTRKLLGNEAFGMRQSLMSVDHLLSSLTMKKENMKEQIIQPIHFTLVSDINVLSLSSFQNDENETNIDGGDVRDEDRNSIIKAETKLMEEVLFQYYLNGDDEKSNAFVTIRLPFVYGPWSQAGSFDYDVVQFAVENASNATLWSNMESRLASLDKQNFLFVDDAVESILTVMQYRNHGSSPDIFNIISADGMVLPSMFAKMIRNMTMSTPNVEIERIENDRSLADDDALQYLSFAPKVNLEEGIAKLFAWHLNRHVPNGAWSPSKNNIEYDTETSVSSNSIFKETGYEFLHKQNVPLCSKDDTYCLRGYHVLPCASECSDTFMCHDTGFDTVIDVTQSLTKNCDRVLYISSFGQDISTIRLKAPQSADKSFCSIAFVSKNSRLVNRNGQHKSHNGWTLVPVDIQGHNDILSAEEIWLPKLSPGKLFHKRVHYAIHLQDDLPSSPKLDDMLFILSLMKWGNEDIYETVQNSKDALILLSALETKKEGKQMESTKTDKLPSLPETNKIASLDEAKEKILDYRGFNEATSRRKLQRRIIMSQQAMLLLNRSQFATNPNTSYKYKLRHWVKTKYVVHNLQLHSAKDLRCDWYKEHIKADDEFDEFSFAHVMAIREIQHFESLREAPPPPSLVDDNDYDGEDTRIRMLERSANNEIEEWISIGKTKEKMNRGKSLVRIVDTERLVQGRRRWNQIIQQQRNDGAKNGKKD